MGGYLITSVWLPAVTYVALIVSKEDGWFRSSLAFLVRMYQASQGGAQNCFTKWGSSWMSDTSDLIPALVNDTYPSCQAFV